MDVVKVVSAQYTKTPDGAFICNNSTMEPLVQNGDYVLINSKIKLRNGDFGIFYFDDNYYLRRYLVQRHATVLLSLNIDTPVIAYDKSQHKYLGKVIGIQRT